MDREEIIARIPPAEDLDLIAVAPLEANVFIGMSVEEADYQSLDVTKLHDVDDATAKAIYDLARASVTQAAYDAYWGPFIDTESKSLRALNDE